MKRVFITGSAGFIGFHLAKLLLQEGFRVHGLDGMTPYYDVGLKRARHDQLLAMENFTASEGLIEDEEKVEKIATDFQPQVIVHLAAQAGVRHSIEKPKAYVQSNVVGTMNIMEIDRGFPAGVCGLRHKAGW